MLHCHPHTGFWLCLLNHTEKQVDFFLPKNNLSRIWKQWFHFLIRASKTGSFNPSSKNKISRPLSILPPLHMLCSVHVALIVPNLELAGAYHWYHPQSIQDYCVFFSSIFPYSSYVGLGTRHCVIPCWEAPWSTPFFAGEERQRLGERQVALAVWVLGF